MRHPTWKAATPRRVEGDVRVQGDPVIRGALPQSATAKLHHPVGDPEEPGGVVPAVAAVGDGRLGPRLDEYRVEPGSALATDGVPRLLRSLLEVLDLECFAIPLTGGLLGQSTDSVGVVVTPPVPTPHEPTTTAMIEADTITIDAGEVLTIGGIGPAPDAAPISM